MGNNIPVGISSSALEDVDLIIGWYELQEISLGYKFVSEFEFSLGKISASPTAYSRYRNSSFVRRYAMKVFPYLIFYYYNSLDVEIIAVIHTSRSLNYIKRRLK